jgi:hypothetical protein
LAAAWTGGRGHIRCWAGRCSTCARRLERAVSWTGGRGHIGAPPTQQDTIAKTGFDVHGNPAATPDLRNEQVKL